MLNFEKYVCENVDETFTDNKLHITTSVDLIVPKYLIIEMNDDTTLNEFIKKYGDIELKLYVSGSVIDNYKIKLLNKIIPIQKMDDNIFVITLLFDKINNPIFRNIAGEMYYILETSEIFKKTHMIIKYIYIDENERRKIINYHVLTFFFQFIQSKEFRFDIPKKFFRLELPFSYLSKGLLLDVNIDNIKNIKLLFEEYARFNYDKNMLKLCAKQISSNFIFIPFDDVDLLNKDVTLFKTGSNFCMVKNLILDIEFENETNEELNVYSICVSYATHSSFGVNFYPVDLEKLKKINI